MSACIFSDENLSNSIYLLPNNCGAYQTIAIKNCPTAPMSTAPITSLLPWKPLSILKYNYFEVFCLQSGQLVDESK